MRKLTRSRDSIVVYVVSAGFAMLMVVSAFVSGSSAKLVDKVENANRFALLSNKGDFGRKTSITVHEARQAILKQPLNAKLANVLVVRMALSQSDFEINPAQQRLLQSLGWRNTALLQNRLYIAAQQKDLDEILRILDALLRRDDLSDQSRAILSLFEQSPDARRKIIVLLASNPPWRQSYFQAYGALQSPLQADARSKLARDMFRANLGLTRAELSATLALLVERGLFKQAYETWRLSLASSENALVYDADFSQAKRIEDLAVAPLPFEWQLFSGRGYWAEYIRNDGKFALSITWDRTGAPTFAQQRLFFPVMMSSLNLKVTGEDIAQIGSILSFKLVCGDSSTRFETFKRVDPNTVLFKGGKLLCESPVLQVGGVGENGSLAYTGTEGGSGGEDITVTIKTITMSTG